MVECCFKVNVFHYCLYIFTLYICMEYKSSKKKKTTTDPSILGFQFFDVTVMLFENNRKVISKSYIKIFSFKTIIFF